jgi:hypothetical protein
VNYDCVLLDCNRITIGDAQIGPAVQIYTAQHPTDPETRRSGPEYALPVTVGDNVWIGGGAILCPGVTIGAHTVVGAGSVVIRDLPPSVIATSEVRVDRERPCRFGDAPRLLAFERLAPIVWGVSTQPRRRVQRSRLRRCWKMSGCDVQGNAPRDLLDLPERNFVAVRPSAEVIWA